MPPACRHVQSRGTPRNVDSGQRRGDVVRIGQNVRPAVVRALLFELIPGCLLNRIESHQLGRVPIRISEKSHNYGTIARNSQ
jgi:hypothetical protein